MPGIGGASTSGAAGAQGSQGKSSVDRDQQAAFGQAMNQAMRGDGQPQSSIGDQKTPQHDEASCTAEVRTKPIGATLNAARHAYIVTRENGERPEGDAPYLGRETQHRGGPEARVQEPADDTTYGDIITDSEEFNRTALDHHGDGEPHPSVHVGTYPGTCDEIDKRLEAAGQKIEVEGHDYRAWPNSQNSNTAAREMLERTGLPIPDDPYGWTPGWEADLPEREPVKAPIN